MMCERCKKDAYPLTGINGRAVCQNCIEPEMRDAVLPVKKLLGLLGFRA